MEEEYNIIVKRTQEDVETSNNLLNNNSRVSFCCPQQMAPNYAFATAPVLKQQESDEIQ